MEKKSFFSRIWDFTKSRKLSLYLLSIFVVALIVGALLKAGSKYVFSTWWFMALALALFLNTLFCTLSRIRSAVKAAFRPPKRASLDFIQKSKNHEQFSYGSTLREAVQSINSVFTGRRYRLKQEETSEAVSISAQKGKFSIWASLIFHSSFVVILLGALLSLTTNLRGSVGLIEGETFTEQHQNYRIIKEAPLFRENHQDFQVRLDKIYLSLDENGRPAEWSSDLVVLDDEEEVKRHHVHVNSALTYKGFVFYQTPMYSYSPLFILKDSEGNVLLDAYVSLSPIIKKGPEFKDSFSIPGSNPSNPQMKVKVQFYPDAVRTGNRLKTKSFIPRKPAVDLEVLVGKKRVFKGPVWLNQSAEFQGLRLTFAGVRFWADFLVVRDQGIPIVFAGFWIGLFGIVLRFWFTNKNIWV
ncbi:MAG: cytochrome c biogenesis protein ResB, partial [Actinomycetota bacterium]